MQSLSAFSQNSMIRNARVVAYEVAKSLSSDFTNQNSSTDLYKVLMETPAHILANVSFKVSFKDFFRY